MNSRTLAQVWYPLNVQLIALFFLFLFEKWAQKREREVMGGFSSSQNPVTEGSDLVHGLQSVSQGWELRTLELCSPNCDPQTFSSTGITWELARMQSVGSQTFCVLTRPPGDSNIQLSLRLCSNIFVPRRKMSFFLFSPTTGNRGPWTLGRQKKRMPTQKGPLISTCLQATLH